MPNIFTSFIKNRSGNFASITAVMLVPILASVGLGVDYIRASQARSVLYGAADAAAIGAVSQSSPTYKKGGLFTADWTKADAEKDALNLFNVNIVDRVGLTIDNVTADVTQSGRKITSKVNFTARVPMTFMRLFGQSDVTIRGEAVAVIDTAPFVDFYLLLDNSPSMGLGATKADIAKLESSTPDSCAFACHTTQQPANNRYDLARSLNITLRIDVVREAAQNLFDKATAMRLHDSQFRMGTYTFGSKAENTGLTEVASLSDDLVKGKSDVGKVDLMTIPFQGYNNDQQTEFDNIFQQLNAKIASPGSGSGPNDRQKIVMFVSDGVADQSKVLCTKPLSGAVRCQEPIDSKICKNLKNRGIKVAVLYTTYQPVTKNSWYMQWINPFQAQIAERMAACATPGYFFEVGPTDGISGAMEALFVKTLGNPRITS